MSIYDPADDDYLESQTLIDLVLDQIVQDVQNKDFTAIEELLNFVPENNLKSFLSEIPYA
jgi:hypothetical protein